MPKNLWQGYFDDMAADYMNQFYAKPWKEEVDFLLDVLNLKPGSRILDLGCGPGRHTVEMARRGYRVTGLDFSAGMLRVARSVAEKAGVDVTWIQADATRFEVTEPFDAIICMLEAAFGFMMPQDEPWQRDLDFLKGINKALKLEARFILGAGNAYQTIRDATQEEVASGEFDPLTMSRQGPVTWTTESGETREIQIRTRTYLPTEITLIMQQAGFEVEHIWGGTIGRNPIGLDDYMITVVAKKKHSV